MNGCTFSSLLDCLRAEVAREYGGRLSSSNDFARLSKIISDSKSGYLSASTLKRLWGYVKDTPTKRTSTLDILSRYIGYDSFDDYKATIAADDFSDSGFNSELSLEIDRLTPGDEIEVNWQPDHSLRLKFLGNFYFEITDSVKSRLSAGLHVRCMHIIKGEPLILDVVRDAEGDANNVYVAGKKFGIGWRRVS